MEGLGRTNMVKIYSNLKTFRYNNKMDPRKLKVLGRLYFVLILNISEPINFNRFYSQGPKTITGFPLAKRWLSAHV